MNKSWIWQTNIYEVNLRQYSQEGTFEVFSRQLPRLQDMGIQTLWFMPLTPISVLERKGSLGSYYACSDYQSINPEFGTAEEFRLLVDKAHRMGFRVIIDWVANHTGWDHVWTKQHPEWYKMDAAGTFKRASGMDDIIELDYSNAEMRTAMIEAMGYWVNTFNIDGFRCDLAFWVSVDFWKQARTTLDKIKPLFWLAEADALEHESWLEVFDAAYTWTWMHKTADYYQSRIPLSDLITLLDRYKAGKGINTWFTSNHDENSWNGTEYEKYGTIAKALMAFSCTWPGIPLIYSGQELPLMKRLKFFDKDPINWDHEPDLHLFYKTLLQLQTTHPALNAKVGVRMINNSAFDKVISFLRSFEGREVLMIINFSSQHVHVDLYADDLQGEFINIFTQEIFTISRQKRFEVEPGGFWALAK